MMLNWFSKLILFTSSYSPLLIIIGIQNYDKPIVWIFVVVFIVVALASLKLIILNVNKYNPYDYTIEKVTSLNSDTVTNYLFIYLFPFITLDLTQIKNVVILLFLFCLVGFLYIKSNIIYINPVLNVVFRYNIFSSELTINNQISKVILITRKSELELQRNKTLKLGRLSKDIFIDIR